MRRIIRALTIVAALLALPSAAQASPRVLDVPLLEQFGEKTNCGPTAAAMIIGAYHGTHDGAALIRLRDAIGGWSWDNFPIRRLNLPGYDAGASTPSILKAALNEFGGDVRFDTAKVHHPWIPQEVWSLVTLKAQIEAGKPVVALVTSRVLWDMPAAVGLHWVVVRGMRDGQVIYNDPADKSRRTVAADRFWEAWALDGIFATLFDRFTALVADRGLR